MEHPFDDPGPDPLTPEVTAPALDGEVRHGPFLPVAVSALPSGLAAAAARQLAALGHSGAVLEVSRFDPVLAARSASVRWSGGEPVSGFITWRAVGEIRVGQLPGLLVAELIATYDEPTPDPAGHRVHVSFVPCATASEAEPVALGWPPRRSSSNEDDGP